MAENSIPYIPTDLHPSILQHLPSKSLLIFLSISKSWYSLIKSPNFIHLHLNQQHNSNYLNDNNHRTFLLKSGNRFYLFRYGNPVGHRRLRLPSPPDGFTTVAASFDTFICLSSPNEQNTLILWNPSINRFKKVQFSLNVDEFDYKLGLDGFKIVMISYSRGSDFMNQLDISPLYAQIYSINNPNLGWKEVPLPAALADHRVTRVSQACVVNGFIYWILFGDDDDDDAEGLAGIEYAICILQFDSKNDCFALMELPTPLKEVAEPYFSLAMVRDSIAVIRRLHFVGEDDAIQVWRMEESWKLCYTIRLYSVSNKKFWAEEDGKAFIAMNSGGLIAFNLNSGDDSGVYKGHVGMTGGHAFNFTQSLLLLDHE